MKSRSARIAAFATVCLFVLAPAIAVADETPAAFRVAIPASELSAAAGESEPFLVPEANAPSGLGVLMPVVGRLIGSGNTLFKTSLDVSNFSASPSAVVFRFHGVDVKTSAVLAFTGTFVNDGGTHERAFSSIHFDDFIDAMVQNSAITPEQESDGILGSMLIVFQGITASGQGAARARFYSNQFGGTIGVAVNGHEVDGTETTALGGAFSDTRTISATPQLYSNIFINNIGHFNAGTGQFDTSDDVVRLSAFSASNGQPIGTPLTVPIKSFQTLSTGLSALGVPAGAGDVVVLAKVTSGLGLLLGVGAEVDDATKDPSGFAMSNVPPSSTGPVPTGGGGDLASQLAGQWTGGWVNTTFQTAGAAGLTITVNSAAKTYSATMTLGGNVFGGTAPPPQTFSGSYSTTTGISYSASSVVFGNVAFTISSTGAINGSLTNVPSPNVSKVTFTGTATLHTITVNYTATLKPSGTAVGVLTLTKP
jgi:hypothetical protein